MSALYVLARICLCVLHFFVRAKANSSVAAHDRINKEALEVAGKLQEEHFAKPADGRAPLQELALTNASFYARLSELAARRDRAEARANRWIDRNDRLTAWRAGLAGFTGRTVPYLVGKVDSFVTWVCAEYYGFGPLTVLFTLTEFVSDIRWPW